MTLDVSKLKALLVMAEYMDETDYYALYHVSTPRSDGHTYLFYVGEDCEIKTEVVTLLDNASENWRKIMCFVRKMTKKFQTREQAEDFLKKIIRLNKIFKIEN